MMEPDPIFPAVATARAANTAHIETLAAWRGIESDEADRACNAAGDRATETADALLRIRPTTRGGLAALVAFLADYVDPSEEGSHYLRHVAGLLHTDSGGPFSASKLEIGSQDQVFSRVIPNGDLEARQEVPGPSDIAAAWHSLPAETRDRIGIIAVDMVFQEFVYGDDCVACGQPEDRAFPDDTPEHDAIRGAAAEASNRRLNELTPLIQGLFPHLFGQPGENPTWCPNPGPRP